MGSVGSGVASEQEFAMRSVGTRTTLPRAPPPPPPAARRGPSGRSCSVERPPPPPSEGAVPSRGDRPGANAAFLSGAGRRPGHRGGIGLDLCGNTVALSEEKTSGRSRGIHLPQCRERRRSKTDNHNPPKILPNSGKLEQDDNGLVRPSAFKPVVPKSFHSMQNLVGQAGGGVAGATSASGSQKEGDSPGGGRGVPGGAAMSDSGRNSLTSLPTYAGSGSAGGPSQTLGPLSASTSHINRLGTAGNAAGNAAVLHRPGYQNGLCASDSGRSSAGKSSSSYQRLSHLGDAPPPLQPSPSSDDVIQELEDRLWEKEQEVLLIRRNLDQSEAAIVQVLEDKQRLWEREVEELRQSCAEWLQQATRRAQRSQQALQVQVARLQQDKRRLQDDLTALLSHREELENKCLDYRKEQADFLPRLEETKWEVCQKAGEISLLKQQLRDSQGEATQRAGEMVALRGQLKDLHAQLKEREEAMLGLRDSFSSKSLQLERSERELQKTLVEVSVLREKLVTFEIELVGLKQALGELSGGGGAVGGFSSPPPPQPDAPTEPPVTPTSPPTAPAEALLRLQSDEAKALHRREEAEALHRREEAEALHRREEAEDLHRREEAEALHRQLERLQGELRLERRQRERQARAFAQERQAWQGEKERVLRHQARLQLGYVEALQRNRTLDRRLGQLGGEHGSASSVPPAASPSTPPAATVASPSLPDQEPRTPAPHQLAPPWPGPNRLERIESTEI